MPQTEMQIRIDDLGTAEVYALLAEHLSNMHEIGPPESVHALDLDALRKPEITLWTAWREGMLLGCAALKELDATHGEIKSMRTADAHRRTGVARRLLEHIIGEARKRSYEWLSLETGSMPEFEPARRLYESHGFVYCGPFADYVEDTSSSFMSLRLR
jgi:putative acetyltransferase